MVQKIDIGEDEGNLKYGLLGLVLAIVEVVRDALRLQAIRRIESGSLTDEEEERLGKALEELDEAIDEMKETQGINEAVQSVRDGLDNIANDVVNKFIDPKEWQKTAKASAR